MAEFVDPETFDAKTAVFDVRRHRHGEQIRGAVHYDPKALEAAERPSLPVAHNGAIVVYGDDEASGERIASHLQSSGYANVRVLRGGIDAWKQKGLPVEEATQDQPVPDVPDAGIPLG